MVYVPQNDLIIFSDNQLFKHLDGKHDQASHGRKGAIPSGFANWNSHIADLIVASEEIDSSRGNALQATIIEAAGFNGKPQILSQAEFDALEGEAVYRAVGEEWQVKDYQESIVQYAGEGTFGNGTYSTNYKDSVTYYAGDTEGNKNLIEARTMEMKLLPEANVMSFDSAEALRDWRSDFAEKFVDQYKASGKNPAEVLDVQWNFANDGDWTNIAIMAGIDAIRFQPIVGDKGEYYTIILNRGKVALNGKS